MYMSAIEDKNKIHDLEQFDWSINPSMVIAVTYTMENDGRTYYAKLVTGEVYEISGYEYCDIMKLWKTTMKKANNSYGRLGS